MGRHLPGRVWPPSPVLREQEGREHLSGVPFHPKPLWAVSQEFKKKLQINLFSAFCSGPSGVEFDTNHDTRPMTHAMTNTP